MRRWKLLVALALAGLTVGVCAAWVLATWPSNLTWDKFARLRKGMTLAEVQEVLGPPGDYCARRPRYDVTDVLESKSRLKQAGREVEVWLYDDAVLTIDFNSDGNAFSIQADSMPTPTANAFDSLVWRLKRQWHRWFP